MKELCGIYPIVPTPFEPSGAVDVASIKSLAQFMLSHGADGLTILGVMGEAHKLTEPERDLVISTFRSEVPPSHTLIVGSSAAATYPALSTAKRSAHLGADALLVAPVPIQNDEIIFEYYRQIDSATEIPLVLHDYPAATGIVLAPSLINRLHRETQHIKYIKVEEQPTGLKIQKLQTLTGGTLGIFGALGGLYAYEELDRGAIGIMTGFAYPEILAKIYRLFRQGDDIGARTLFYDALPLIRFEFQASLGVSLRKELLVRRGAIRHATVRHPGPVADTLSLQHLDRIIAHLHSRGIILSD